MFHKFSMNIFILKGKFLKQLDCFGKKRREKRQKLFDLLHW